MRVLGFVPLLFVFACPVPSLVASVEIGDAGATDASQIQDVASCIDGDGDQRGEGCAEPDCNDNDPTQFREIVLYIDADGDGFTLINSGEPFCIGDGLPEGFSAVESETPDCDDTDATLNTTEVILFVDEDGDGFTLGEGVPSCVAGILPGTTDTSLGNDCDDNDATRTLLSYIDNDDDGFAQSEEPTTCVLSSEVIRVSAGVDCNDDDGSLIQLAYVDEDGDHYSPSSTSECIGERIDGYVVVSLGIDCDDENGEIYRSLNLYDDDDEDGYTEATAKTRCLGAEIPNRFKEIASDIEDCEDDDPNLNVGVEGYRDEDGDGYTTGGLQRYCVQQGDPGVVEIQRDGDCNDENENINPDAVEVCDSFDNNCVDGADENEVCGQDCIARELRTIIGDSYIGTYLRCNTQANYQQAIDRCSDVDGYQLVKIDNLIENEALRLRLRTPNFSYWIGLNDRGSEGNYVWTQGGNQIISPNPFAPFEPNNLFNEDCIEMSAGGWNDNDCANGLSFICEKTN